MSRRRNLFAGPSLKQRASTHDSPFLLNKSSQTEHRRYRFINAWLLPNLGEKLLADVSNKAVRELLEKCR
jgi:hypothetical protein